jgi:hypothetical protein
LLKEVQAVASLATASGGSSPRPLADGHLAGGTNVYDLPLFANGHLDVGADLYDVQLVVKASMAQASTTRRTCCQRFARHSIQCLKPAAARE